LDLKKYFIWRSLEIWH